MAKQTAQVQKKFFRNVRIIGLFFVALGAGFTVLFEFDLIAFLFGLFFATIGAGIAIYPKSAKIFIDSLIETIATK